MAEFLKVGVIGCTGRGNYGHGLDTVWKDVPETKVVAVADPDDKGRMAAQARTGATTTYADYREMLRQERLDIVAMAPRWIDQHREMALAIAESGAHIYAEKPFMRTPAEADEVIRACEMRHLRLAQAHQTRYSPTVAMARKLIEDGEIGRVLELRGRGKEDRRGGGEDLWVLGSHILDLMRFLVGAATDCHAVVSVDNRPARPADITEGPEGLGPLIGDSIHARYSFPNGVVGYFDSVRNQGGSPSRFALQVLGSKGILELEFGYLLQGWLLRDPAWSPGRSKANWLPITSAGVDRPETRTDAGTHGGNVAAVRDLLAAIQEQRDPLCNMYDGRAVTEMIVGVFASHRAGKTVPLPLVERGHPLAGWS